MKLFDIFLESPIDPAQIYANQTDSIKLEYPIHYHPSMELLYCHDGSLMLHLDQNTHTMVKDSFALISPMAVHGFSCPETCSCTFIHVPEKVFLQVEHIFSLSAQHTGYIFEGSVFKEAVMKIYEFAKKNDQTIASYYAMILLTLCVRCMQETQTQVISYEGNSYPLLREILLFIQNNYKNTITLDLLCAKFNISKSSMSRLINKDLQSSLPELINKYRMLEANHLLLQTQQSVAEISDQLGYSSVCSFNRNFLKQYGVAPREYRKQQRNV